MTSEVPLPGPEFDDEPLELQIMEDIYQSQKNKFDRPFSRQEFIAAMDEEFDRIHRYGYYYLIKNSENFFTALDSWLAEKFGIKE